jgi:corrinoid protein of di/trimethylamine methyltransferase
VNAVTTQVFQEMAQSIINGDSEISAKLAQQAIVQGIDPLEAISHGFVVGVNQVGEAFARGDAFLPELVMAGEAMKAAVAVLEPELTRRDTERKVLGKIILCTVEGDIHEIGKTLVGTMLSSAGFKVFDLDVDVPVMKVVEMAREVNADIVAMSALLTTTMIHQKDVIEALEDIGIRSKVKVLVGGAPVTKEWVNQIGADGYSEDAIGAINVAKYLLSF